MQRSDNHRNKKPCLDGFEVESLENVEHWDFNEYKPIYSRKERAIVKKWNDCFQITRAEYSLEIGKQCLEYRLVCWNDGSNIINEIFRPQHYNLSEILDYLSGLPLSPTYSGSTVVSGITISASYEKAIKVITPWGLENRRHKARNKPSLTTVIDGVTTIINPDSRLVFLAAGDNGENVAFELGDTVQVDSYNLHYYGTITAIKPKYVETYGCPNGLIHNEYKNILWRNRSKKGLSDDHHRDMNWSD